MSSRINPPHRYLSSLALTMLLTVFMISGLGVGRAYGGACLDCTRECCAASKTTGITACSCARSLSCLRNCNELCCPVVFQPGFDDTAAIDPDGKHIVLSGHVMCDEGVNFHLRLTVTQHGSVAEANANGVCGSGSTLWDASGHTYHFPGLIPGPATACGLAIADNGFVSNSTQWCKEITLEE